MRSALSLLAATGLLATGVAAAVPAQAETATAAVSLCYPTLPAKLVMNKRHTIYTVGYGAGCGTAPNEVWNADWSGTTPGDPQDIFFELLNGAKTTTIDLDSIGSPKGVITFVGNTDEGSGDDKTGNHVADLATVKRMNKYASAVDLTVTKSRGVATLATAAGNYRPSTNKFVPWTGKQIILQSKQAGTSTWKQLAKVTTNSTGKASFKWAPTATFSYRAYIAGNSVVWDDYSPVR